MHLDHKVYQRLREGDMEAFRQIFDAFSGRIYTVALRILKEEQMADEVVQDTFIKLWQSREDVDPTKDLWPFLFVMAKRICFNELRALRYDSKAQKELLRRMNHLQEDHRMALREMEQLLKDSVVKLPPRQQQVWIMSREEGKSHQEIAEELGISPNTVKNNIVQTLKTLRDVFRKADYLYLPLFFFFL